MRINVLPRLAESKPANQFVNWALKEKVVVKNNVETKVTNYSKLQKVFPDAFMVFLAAMQCYYLNKSKEMPEERKIPLMFNNLYSCTIALCVGGLMKKPIGAYTEKIVKRANDLYAKNPHKSNLINGIKTSVPFAISAFLFHYVGPVIATPLSTQTTSFLVKKGLIKFSDKTDKSKTAKVGIVG